MNKALKNSDVFIQEYSLEVYKLSILEIQKKVKLAHKLFEKLLNILYNRRKLIEDSILWKELYNLSIFFYPYIQNIGSIPLCIVTSHNHVVPWYIKQLKDVDANVPIIHFDTHSDLNNVLNSKNLPYIADKYANGTDYKSQLRLQKKIMDIVWDIGAAMSGVLLSTEPRDHIWVMPKWLPDPVGLIHYSTKKHYNQVNLISDDDNFDKMKTLEGEFQFLKINDESDTRHYGRTRIEKSSKQLREYIELSNSNGYYILDIDLDYFVCNGRPLRKRQYFQGAYDVQSTKRVPEKEFIDYPRGQYYDDRAYVKYRRVFMDEVSLIRKRITKFFKCLKYLKNHGLIPKLISISDSTSAEFTACIGCPSTSNNYVPKQLVLYIHTKVMDGLRDLFG